MSRKCHDCYFFKNKWKLGKSEVNCFQLGTEGSDQICGDFQRAKDKVKDDKDPILSAAFEDIGIEGKTLEESFFAKSQKDNFFDIISDIFKMEQDVSKVIEKIRDEIDRQGYNIPFNKNQISGLVSKLSTLFLTYRMSLAFGQQKYVDSIMEHSIDRLFAHPMKYGPPPRMAPIKVGAQGDENDSE